MLIVIAVQVDMASAFRSSPHERLPPFGKDKARRRDAGFGPRTICWEA